MKKTISLLAMFLFACGDEPAPTKTETPTIVTTIPTPRPQPEPVPVKECAVTRTTEIRDCVLYDLICDDGDTDMVLLCPIQYWEKGPYIPLPP